MKTSYILYIALLISSAGSLAQGPESSRPLFDFRKKKVDEETKSKAIDAARNAVKQVPDNIQDKAKELLLSPESAEMRQKALQAAQSVMQGTPSSPAGATTTPATETAPAPSAPIVAVVAPPPSGPQPQPLQPLNLDEAPKATKSQIDITAQKSSFFDGNTNYAIFTGDVKARHPQMYIECEELELFMAKQGGSVLGAPKPKTTRPAAKDADILAAPKKAANSAPPIDKADARGPMVTIEKISEDGELQIGHCKHLIYDGKTERTTLLEWPQVQAGNQLHKATEAGCIMIIEKTGKLTTTGGHETIILQGDEVTPRRNGMNSPAPAPQ
ncbi:LptA/OstA family protein [Prosthecobacter sp.]|uniref:LptA/OstA family protein n=1 Tax=Prosthecobacter sp. TaxID=1965333 RepID=UPI00248757CE|nr:LptA/OstA family protein [Prosthecobacter sp.]MDI1313584.1 LptA/OstA family protein [Prosthecobacter sp.]